jgi:hypothetical protein
MITPTTQSSIEFFCRPPFADESDYSEYISDGLLRLSRTAFGSETHLFAPVDETAQITYEERNEVPYLYRFCFGLLALTVWLPLTLLGLFILSLSDSHALHYRRYLWAIWKANFLASTEVAKRQQMIKDLFQSQSYMADFKHWIFNNQAAMEAVALSIDYGSIETLRNSCSEEGFSNFQQCHWIGWIKRFNDAGNPVGRQELIKEILENKLHFDMFTRQIQDLPSINLVLEAIDDVSLAKLARRVAGEESFNRIFDAAIAVSHEKVVVILKAVSANLVADRFILANVDQLEEAIDDSTMSRFQGDRIASPNDPWSLIGSPRQAIVPVVDNNQKMVAHIWTRWKERLETACRNDDAVARATLASEMALFPSMLKCAQEPAIYRLMVPMLLERLQSGQTTDMEFLETFIGHAHADGIEAIATRCLVENRFMALFQHLYKAHIQEEGVDAVLLALFNSVQGVALITVTHENENMIRDAQTIFEKFERDLGNRSDAYQRASKAFLEDGVNSPLRPRNIRFENDEDE